MWDDSPWDCFHILVISLPVLSREELFFVDDAPDHDRNRDYRDNEGEQGIEKERKSKPNDEDRGVMGMPNVLENPSRDELTFIGPMPEDLPFEVDEGS